MVFPDREADVQQELMPRVIDALLVAAIFAGKALIALAGMPSLLG